MKEINGTKIYTAQEVGELLGVSYTTVLKYMRVGRIAKTKLGHKTYVSEQSLLNFLNGVQPRKPQETLLDWNK